MSNRGKDWLRQAKSDLNHAKNAKDDEDFEWSCFASQQSAEKALKAVYLHLNQEAWGHSVKSLLENLPGKTEVNLDLVDRAKVLDKYYIPTRYPNGFDEGIPADYYTKEEALKGIEHANTIVGFCEGILSQPGRDQKIAKKDIKNMED